MKGEHINAVLVIWFLREPLPSKLLLHDAVEQESDPNLLRLFGFRVYWQLQKRLSGKPKDG